MAKAAFRCSRCGRTFTMKAHLARHMNTTHSRGGATKKTKTSKKKRGPGRPKGSRNKPRAVTASAMASAEVANGSGAIVQQMQHLRNDLLNQRTAIDAGIDAISRAIDAMGGSAGPATMSASRPAAPARRGRGRPKGSGGRPGSLKDYIVRVLGQSAQPLSPREIGARIKRAGYSTKAQDLTKAVSNTLPDMPNVRRVGFGQYATS